MYARVLRISGDPAKADDGIEAYRSRVAPALNEQDGYAGARLLINSETGAGMSVTFWQDEQTLRASESALAGVRGDTTSRFGADAPVAELLAPVGRQLLGSLGASLDPRDVTVVAAMGVEARPVARHTPQLRLVRAGIGLATLDRHLLTTPVVLSVGLAGGLDGDLVSGTVVIPAQVAREDGVLLVCDPAWSAALEGASRRLGYPTSTASLLSADALVTHAGREVWAARGFAAVDMETAVLAGMVPRVAAVRVVLDTPSQEISPAWEHPARAALDPRNWRDGAWLMRAAPRFARRAALVVAAALADAQVTLPRM